MKTRIQVSIFVLIIALILPVSAAFTVNGAPLGDGDYIYNGDWVSYSNPPRETVILFNPVSLPKQHYWGGNVYRGDTHYDGWQVSPMGEEPYNIQAIIATNDTVFDEVVVNYTYSGVRPINPPQALFTVDPGFEGHPPFYIRFFDISQNIESATFAWDFGNGQLYSGNYPNPNEYLEMTYPNEGNYTVSLSLSATNGTSTYSEKISVYNASVILPNDVPNSSAGPAVNGVTVNLDIKDAITGALIQNAGCGIYNSTSHMWRNTTAPTGLVYYDSTDNMFINLSKGQTITLAAWDTGHKPDSVTFKIPYDNYRAILNLVPNTLVSANGTGAIVVTTVRNKDGLPISGASVSLENGQMGSTNTAGAITFQNVTAGDHTVSVSTPYYSYSSTSQSVSLSAGETKMVMVQLVEIGQTPVPTYIAPTTTSGGAGTGTYAGNYSAGALNAQGGQGLLEMMGMLIKLWPLALIMLFLYFLKKVTQ
ncbi:carboxypeptidase regulatory-like domain-containing protein [Methanoregula sp.]|uniref:carboxypeptidase regulatory-like domain-containing protein n=1 Tax=Methanoregula sp. TaxID=2052170 RepID=UPI0035665D15